MKYLIFALFLSASSAWATAPTCPLGTGEDHLTIQRVMINFGHYTMGADSVALKDVTPEQVVTDKEISQAVSDLQVAQACADAVLANPTGDLLPDSAQFVTGEQRAKLISDYLSFMQEFSDGLGDYQDVLNTLLTVPATSRNFDQAYQESQYLDALVTRAHRETSFDGDPNTHTIFFHPLATPLDIDDTMKQINVNFSAIKKTLTIPADNSSNSTAAKNMAALFGTVIDQVPDSIKSLPADQQAAATADFQSMIQQEIDLSNQLASAFDQNDNNTAANLVQQMNAIKMNGHNKYDP